MNYAALSHEQKDFAILADEVDEAPTLRFTGDASLGIEIIGQILRLFHEEASAAKPAHVVVDLRGLGFINSAGFKCFISWLAAIEALAPEARYRVRLVGDPATHHVHRSLRALRSFAPDVVDILEGS